MRCDHRFKLVGYREAPQEEEALKLAVLVCLKCTRACTFGVDEIPPAPIIDASGRSAVPAGIVPEGEAP